MMIGHWLIMAAAAMTIDRASRDAITRKLARCLLEARGCLRILVEEAVARLAATGLEILEDPC